MLSKMESIERNNSFALENLTRNNWPTFSDKLALLATSYRAPGYEAAAWLRGSDVAVPTLSLPTNQEELESYKKQFSSLYRFIMEHISSEVLNELNLYYSKEVGDASRTFDIVKFLDILHTSASGGKKANLFKALADLNALRLFNDNGVRLMIFTEFINQFRCGLMVVCKVAASQQITLAENLKMESFMHALNNNARYPQQASAVANNSTTFKSVHDLIVNIHEYERDIYNNACEAPVPNVAMSAVSFAEKPPKPGKKFDRANNGKSKFKRNAKHSNDRTDDPICYNCGRKGHKSNECTKSKAHCDICTKDGHLGKFCKKKGKAKSPQDAGRIDSALTVHTMHEDDDCDDEDIELHCAKGVRFKGMSCIERNIFDWQRLSEIKAHAESIFTAMKVETVPNPTFRIDTGASITILKDRDALGALGKAYLLPDKKLLVSGIQEGTLRSTHAGLIPGLGRVAVIPECTENLISVSEWTFHGKIRFCFETDQVVLSRGTSTIATVSKNSDGYCISGEDLHPILTSLYGVHTCKVAVDFEDKVVDMTSDEVEPVELKLADVTGLAKTKPLSKDQLKRAEMVRNIHFLFNHCSDDYLINALKAGVLHGSGITTQDVHNCREHFGRCIHCLAGKEVRKDGTESSYLDDVAEVGDVLHVDVCSYAHDQYGDIKNYLFCVDEYSGYALIVNLKRKSQPHIIKGFEILINHFSLYGHKVKAIRTDSENNFLASADFLLQKGVKFQPLEPFRHEKRCERYIRTAMDRCRAVLDGLPYELPKNLFSELLLSVVRSMNDLPNSMHPTQSPITLVEHTPVDMKTRPTVPFGQVCSFISPGKQIEGNDKMAPRAELGIALGRAAETPGTIRCFLFKEKKIYKRSRFVMLKYLPVECDWKIKSIHYNASSIIKNVFVQNSETVRQNANAAGSAVPGQPLRGISENRPPPQSTILRTDNATVNSIPIPTTSVLPVSSNNSSFGESSQELSAERGVISSDDPNTADAFIEYPAQVDMDLVQPTLNDPSPSADATTSSDDIYQPVTNEFQDVQMEPMSDVATEPIVQSNDSSVLASSETILSESHLNILSGNKHDSSGRIKKSRNPSTDYAAPKVTKSGRRAVNHKYWNKNYTGFQPDIVVLAQLLESAYHVAVKDGLNGIYAAQTREAIREELRNMIDFGVGTYVKFIDIPVKARNNIVVTFMIIRHKTHPDGSFDKTKARLVADGCDQPENTFDLISSSTVTSVAIFMILNVASYYGTRIVSYDIKGAFLQCPVKESDKQVYIRIRKDIAKLWLQIDPEAAAYLTDRGELILKLNKYIYGLKQSPLMFQRDLIETLVDTGYRQLNNDDCIFVKYTEDGGFSFLSVHVDDVLQTANKDELIEELHSALIKRYGTITFHDKAEGYLGMQLEQSKDKKMIKLRQTGIIKDIIKLTEDVCKEDLSTAKTPAQLNLFNADPNAKPLKTNKFLSMVMKLMYVARLTRPDILMPVTYLAARAHVATMDDFTKLKRVVQYLKGTIENALVINCNSLDLLCYCDASYGVHADGKSHTGFVFGYGDNLSHLHSRSVKQKLTALSSTEAEVLALLNAATTGQWIVELHNELMTTLGKGIDTVRMMQDNKSTMILAMEPCKARRSKHILTKLSYIRQLVNENKLAIEHCPTEQMIADLLTKPLIGKLFVLLCAAIMGIRIK